MLNLFGVNPKKKVDEPELDLILRIAIKHFLADYHKTETLNSKKICHEFKLSHLKGAREFENFVLEALNHNIKN